MSETLEAKPDPAGTGRGPVCQTLVRCWPVAYVALVVRPLGALGHVDPECGAEVVVRSVDVVPDVHAGRVPALGGQPQHGQQIRHQVRAGRRVPNDRPDSVPALCPLDAGQRVVVVGGSALRAVMIRSPRVRQPGPLPELRPLSGG
jgi:hypothetical protein